MIKNSSEYQIKIDSFFFFKRCVTWNMKKGLNSDLNIETEKINFQEENKIGGAYQ
jgi:hypothetical protein